MRRPGWALPGHRQRHEGNGARGCGCGSPRGTRGGGQQCPAVPVRRRVCVSLSERVRPASAVRPGSWAPIWRDVGTRVGVSSRSRGLCPGSSSYSFPMESRPKPAHPDSLRSRPPNHEWILGDSTTHYQCSVSPASTHYTTMALRATHTPQSWPWSRDNAVTAKAEKNNKAENR